ncbi:MAG: bifunctional diguanylate cyclase/phosphodiesterase, partial [Selenomonadaceae bacterium]
RVSLNMRLADELEKARLGEAEGVLLFIDMDDFKTVNDTFGHSAGDKVIVAAAQCLKKAFDEGAFVSHISGDEFIVIVSGNATIEKATQLARRALAKLCREYDVVEKQIQLSASIGVVLYPQHGDMPEDLLKKADAAMYVAKAAGRNCWRFFEPELLKKTAEDTLLINSLRRALPRNEFFLQYKPQMTADGRTLVGLEALLRWNSPEHGFVSPARFIPLAERSRLIVEIGQWVFVQACCFAKKLADRGKSNLRVAVNISPRQIKDDDFVSRVRAVIEASGILPEQIELEVTETVLMENLDDGVPKLRELQKDGVNLALDDFGTGFSSLTYLRTLPVNCLKIDKSFIDGIAFDQMQMRFVESIINLGHTLEMEIVAEGVETKEQLEHLVNCRCDYIQGYVFSKPISEEEALELCQGFSSSAKKE